MVQLIARYIDSDDENKNDFDNEEDDESLPTSKKTNTSEESSDGFKKHVDFLIDKETSEKIELGSYLARVNQNSNNNNNNVDSAPTTSRDQLDSPTKNYLKATLNLRDEGLIFSIVFWKIIYNFLLNSDLKPKKSFLQADIPKNDKLRLGVIEEEKNKMKTSEELNLKLVQLNDKLEK